MLRELHPGKVASLAICFSKLVSAVCLSLLLVPAALRADTPISPDASRESRALLAFLHHTYGKNIISGQQEGWRGTNDLGFELSYIRDASGKIPALLAMDVAPYTKPPAKGYRREHAIVRTAIDWYRNRNGIVSLCWHWSAPMDDPAFYTKETAFTAEKAVQKGTPGYEAAIRDIDLIAAELKLLRDAGIPVLWRPLHEANGGWFWWGASGPESFKALWRVMFDRLLDHHKLNNLIWVFSPGAGLDLGEWYPGDAYVDIIAPDHYPMDGNNGPAKGIFDEMVALGGGSKLVGFGENGPIPAPDRLKKEKAGWLFFIAWSGETLTGLNTREQIRRAYNDPYVLNLGDLPDLRSYQFETAGKPARLAFPVAPADLAVGSPGRRPFIVAVQDKAGRTVREGVHKVTLASPRADAPAQLRGPASVETVNGLAVFPEFALSARVEKAVIVATAPTLRAARSPVFRVGPGSGIQRDVWTNGGSLTLDQIRNLSVAPQRTEILGKAFEAPVETGTNYLARYRGYLSAPSTGQYVFWMANEGVSELWLGSNDQPTSKVKILELTRETPYSKWPHTHEACSGLVQLKAGKMYYIEAFQSQPSGSGHLSLRWVLPDGTEERPIPGARFSTPGDYEGAKNVAKVQN